MGIDKATLVVEGRPLALVAADALRQAGAAEVFAVGGDATSVRELGLDHVPDRWPGEGPLGGIITALHAARHDVICVLACDLPDVSPAAVREVLAGLDPGVAVVVGAAGGRTHPLIGVYRRSALRALETAFESGERAVRAGLGSLQVGAVNFSRAEWSRNVNFPHDLG